MCLVGEGGLEGYAGSFSGVVGCGVVDCCWLMGWDCIEGIHGPDGIVDGILMSGAFGLAHGSLDFGIVWSSKLLRAVLLVVIRLGDWLYSIAEALGALGWLPGVFLFLDASHSLHSLS